MSTRFSTGAATFGPYLALLLACISVAPTYVAASEDDEPVGEVETLDVDVPTPAAGDLAPSGILALGWPPIIIKGEHVEPGERRDIGLRLTESFAGAALDTPVMVVHGSRPGPTICLTGGIHGDEINGMESVRRLVDRLDPSTLRGTVIGAPIVNLHGFQRGMRYLPDRRDLNRFFPGNAYGSSASRIANLLFHYVIVICDGLVDFHTGSLHRTNLPQVRGDLRNAEVQRLARRFSSGVIVHNPAKKGTIRRAAMDHGIPAIIFEAGEPMRLQEEEIELGVRGTLGLLAAFDMLDREQAEFEPAPVYFATHWVRANDGGILRSRVAVGDEVQRGDVLGHITDPVNTDRVDLRSDYTGRVIGMTLSPIMIPGYAAYHIGVDTPRSGIELSPMDDESADAPPQDFESVEGVGEDERPE